jgi:OOP family OmpA-OmpF porin
MVTNRKAWLAALFSTAAFVAPSAALAQAQGDSGWYLGGSIGQTEFKDFCKDIQAPGGITGGSCDEKDKSWKFFGGYQVNRHLAVEGSFINWGETSVNGTFAGLPTSGTAEVTSWGIAGVGILPLGERFSLFGKLGFLRTEAEVRVNVAGFPGTGDESETEAHFGLGARFNLTNRFGARLEWERANDTKADMLSIGLQYRF